MSYEWMMYIYLSGVSDLEFTVQKEITRCNVSVDEPVCMLGDVCAMYALEQKRKMF